MDKILVEGGKPLEGTVRASGAKNAALPAMTAALLADGVTTVRNVPRLRDIHAMGDLLEILGCRFQMEEDVLRVDAKDASSFEAPYDIVRKMRASIYVLGPLLARFGQARVSLPGGCSIGDRPIDLHLRGMRALGARVELKHGYIVAEADRLQGADVDLVGPRGSSVGATVNVLSAASLAQGVTRILGAAKEPEVVEFIRILRGMGARVEGEGTRTLTVEGVDSLKAGEFSIIPDRIEAGTFLVAGAITGGRVTVTDCRPVQMEGTLEALRRAGVQIEVEEDRVTASRSGGIKPIELVTGPYPEFPTDMQAQVTALLCLAQGVSRLTDHIYPDRFIHVRELIRLGARITRIGGQVEIVGVEGLSAAPVMASDLRASAALVLAGLAAQGVTQILRVYHIDRGYEQIERKMASLGARIWRERE